jgi:hypothetical protein
LPGVENTNIITNCIFEYTNKKSVLKLKTLCNSLSAIYN